MKILANDGIATSGVEALEEAGFEVDLKTIAQEQLVDYLNSNEISVLLVRSATKVRKDIIDNCPSLKIIGRGGVGMDNIDVEYAREKGIKVINTPAASSHSVAELVFAHLFSMVRFLHESNRNMPLEGDSKFKQLKKSGGQPGSCNIFLFGLNLIFGFEGFDFFFIFSFVKSIAFFFDVLLIFLNSLL